MGEVTSKLISFSSIELAEPIIQDKSVVSTITLNKNNGENKKFELSIKYENKLDQTHLPLLRMAFFIPLLNYGLFTKKFLLDFPISKIDLFLLNKLNFVFSRDIFVNKILRPRANYILPEFLINEKNVNYEDANPNGEIIPLNVIDDSAITTNIVNKRCGVLSSGGKESLLTYGILKEIGSEVYPLYVNESGGHWRTAIPAYNYHLKNEENTHRIWTNVDRFYNFMLDNLNFIRSDHRKIWADTYPIRLCIFPFYVFALLPIFVENNIGNLLIGSEFDDLRVTPQYHGINHYFGVYDQHQDYDIEMNKWYKERIPRMVQWSAVRNISGLIVERILTRRYSQLASLQRSCHSCHFENREIVPCGKCSKCMGILLFLLANDVDPKIMNFKEKDIELFSKRINPNNLRLDEDEKNQSFYLIGSRDKTPNIRSIDHVEKIHVNRDNCDLELIPNHLREDILEILKEYTTGFCELKNENWAALNELKIIL
ncbi:MAG: hypothetical protein JXA91_07645 [Candidatus Thermoplasmatota archaeon]|nr:hypothetical protein [Candidatus Thermoplasmatota archaeon]